MTLSVQSTQTCYSNFMLPPRSQSAFCLITYGEKNDIKRRSNAKMIPPIKGRPKGRWHEKTKVQPALSACLKRFQLIFHYLDAKELILFDFSLQNEFVKHACCSVKYHGRRFASMSHTKWRECCGRMLPVHRFDGNHLPRFSSLFYHDLCSVLTFFSCQGPPGTRQPSALNHTML